MTGTLNGVYVIILKVCFFCIIEKEPLGICSSNTNNDSSNQLCVYSNQDLKKNWSLGSLSWLEPNLYLFLFPIWRKFWTIKKANIWWCFNNSSKFNCICWDLFIIYILHRWSVKVLMLVTVGKDNGPHFKFSLLLLHSMPLKQPKIFIKWRKVKLNSSLLFFVSLVFFFLPDINIMKSPALIMFLYICCEKIFF